MSKKYTYENFGRPLSIFELKTVGEVSVWHEYNRLKKSSEPNVALQELLKRHDSILQILARKLHRSFNLTSEYEDKLQHARIGAMRAYDKFDCEKAQENHVQLSTYVSNNVGYYLQDCNDTDAFINCPPGRRMIRNYLNGVYDSNSEKKIEVKKRLSINSLQDHSDLFQKYSTLVPTYIPIDTSGSIIKNSNNLIEGVIDFTPEDEKADTPEDIAIRLSLLEHMQKLTSRQQKVLYLLHEQKSLPEISYDLKTPESTLRGDVQTIRKIMKRLLKEENEETALIS